MKEDLELEIEKYLTGTMSPEEALVFETKIDADEALKNEVLLTEDLNLFLKNRSSDISNIKEKPSQEEIEIRKNIKEVHNKFKEKSKESNTKQKNGNSKLIYLMTSIAAVVLLFAGVYFSSSSSNNSELYASYYTSSDLPSFTTRSGDDNLLSKATTSYRGEDYDKALSLFETYIKTSDAVDPLAYIYTGMIYAEKNQLDASISQLELLEKSNSIDAERAYWFKALVYLKFDDKQSAIKNLKVLQSSKSNYKKTEVNNLLDEL